MLPRQALGVRKGIAAGAICATLCSCAAALIPGVPAGPIMKPGLRIGGSYSYAYAPGTVHAVDGNAADRAAPRVTVHHDTAMLWAIPSRSFR